jgi:hypothetical protein
MYIASTKTQICAAQNHTKTQKLKKEQKHTNKSSTCNNTRIQQHKFGAGTKATQPETSIG